MAKQKSIRIPSPRQLDSGSWFLRIMIDGRSIPITRTTREACIAEYIALKHGAKEADFRSKTNVITLRECLGRYIDKRRDRKSPSTIKAYEAYAANRLQNLMDENVYEISDDRWQSAVDKDFRKLSAKYAKNVWSFVAAAVQEQTGKRPRVELDPPQRNSRPFLEPDEVLKFVDAIHGSPAEIAALLELSSLRVSEVLDVRGTDVDLKNNRIRVQGSAVYGPGGILIHKSTNKTRSSSRYSPIIPPLRPLLESIPLTDEYLVTTRANVLYNQINRVCRAAGLPEVGNHGLRHSFASLAYHLGIEEKIAMEIGGWGDSKTMHDIYTHLAEKDIAKRSELLANFFITNSLQK